MFPTKRICKEVRGLEGWFLVKVLLFVLELGGDGYPPIGVIHGRQGYLHSRETRKYMYTYIHTCMHALEEIAIKKERLSWDKRTSVATFAPNNAGRASYLVCSLLSSVLFSLTYEHCRIKHASTGLDILAASHPWPPSTLEAN
jgi:hypothetical protein